MTNTFMAEYYASLSQAIVAAKKAKDNLATVYMDRLSNFRPTPSVAEMAIVMNGGAVNLASSSISSSITMRPASCSLAMQRKFPIRT